MLARWVTLLRGDLCQVQLLAPDFLDFVWCDRVEDVEVVRDLPVVCVVDNRVKYVTFPNGQLGEVFHGGFVSELVDGMHLGVDCRTFTLPGAEVEHSFEGRCVVQGHQIEYESEYLSSLRCCIRLEDDLADRRDSFEEPFLTETFRIAAPIRHEDAAKAVCAGWVLSETWGGRDTTKQVVARIR